MGPDVNEDRQSTRRMLTTAFDYAYNTRSKVCRNSHSWAHFNPIAQDSANFSTLLFTCYFVPLSVFFLLIRTAAAAMAIHFFFMPLILHCALMPNLWMPFIIQLFRHEHFTRADFMWITNPFHILLPFSFVSCKRLRFRWICICFFKLMLFFSFSNSLPWPGRRNDTHITQPASSLQTRSLALSLTNESILMEHVEQTNTFPLCFGRRRRRPALAFYFSFIHNMHAYTRFVIRCVSLRFLMQNV